MISRMMIAAPWVASLGLIGVFLRWCLQLAAVRSLELPVYWATLGINAVGSLLIGMVVGVSQIRPGMFSEPVRAGLTVGFLGGFTTFSAYSIESWSLLSQGQWARGGVLFLGSPILGIVCAALGVALVRYGLA